MSCSYRIKTDGGDRVSGEGKTTYMLSVSVNAFSVEFPLACYQQAGRVWYVSGALRRMYMLFYPAPTFCVVRVEDNKVLLKWNRFLA